MELWTFLNPILKIFFYLSVVGTAGTALFIFHFRKLMEKENILTDKEIVSVLSFIKSTWPSQIQEIHNNINIRSKLN